MAKAKAKKPAKPPAKARPAAKAKARPAAKAKARPAAKAKPAAAKPSAAAPSPPERRPAGPVLRGIRSVIFQVDDLARAKAFYSAALGRSPYFDQPFYAGYDIDGQELGLHPDLSKLRPGAGGAVAYWKVDDIANSWDYLLSLGGRAIEPPHDVGGDIHTAIIADPFGNLVGLIQLAS
jgi:predicted enzyme related to lactoylglutathione lyase